jgi:hypothetical protein
MISPIEENAEPSLACEREGVRRQNNKRKTEKYFGIFS